MGAAFKPRSFRMRLLLLSVSISTAILLGFGAWTWQLLYGLTGLDRLDGEMKALGRSQLSVPRRGGDWSPFEDLLGSLAQLNPTHAFAFAVIGRDGRTRYQSAQWPESLPLDRLLDPAFLPAMPEPEPDFQDPPRERRRLDGGRAGNPEAPAGPGRRAPWGEGPRPGLGGPPPVMPVREIAVKTIAAGDSRWRANVMANPHDLLIVAADLVPFYAEVNALRRTSLLVFALALFCIGAGGWFLAHRALRPVEALIAAAESITAQGLDQRIPEGETAEEFARLNRVFNNMLERLDRSFKQATRFSADAAHELKTPLTILQGQLNQLLQEAPDGSPLQQKLGQLLEEVQRLSVIIRRLLLLSLADAGRIKVNLEPVALDEFLATIIEDVEILAPDLTVKADLAAGVTVGADKTLLRQAVQNLVNNAIKYNVPGGTIRFELFRHEGKVRFTVANTSQGIPEEARKRVFHRFYRADPAHSRDVDGVGLGLSLAREIVRSHGGKLWLADAPAGWVMFVMELSEAPGPAARE